MNINPSLPWFVTPRTGSRRSFAHPRLVHPAHEPGAHEPGTKVYKPGDTGLYGSFGKDAHTGWIPEALGSLKDATQALTVTT